MNYSIADGSGSPYAANMIENLIHGLIDADEIREINALFSGI